MGDDLGGSAKALVDIGRGGRARSGSKFDHRDAVLVGFCSLGCSTAKEVATEYYNWQRELYANASKRAHDLFLVGYLERCDDRKCRYTGKMARTYRITQRGIDYLRGVSKLPKVEEKLASKPTPKVRPDFKGMRGMLNA